MQKMLRERANFVKQHPRLFIFFSLVLAMSAINSIAFATGYFGLSGEPGRNGNQARLINNWVITPVGKQTPLGDWPATTALSPDGKHLLVTNAGAGDQALQVIETSSSKIVQTLTYVAPQSVFLGVTYSPDGKHAYATGGGSDIVHTYDVQDDGTLKEAGAITIDTTANNPYPTGLSISPDGSTLYVANNLANTVSVVDIASKAVMATIPIGSYPYTTLVSKDGKTVYASNWGDGSISVIDATSKKVVTSIKVGSHPNSMALGPGDTLYVANANSDTVSVVDTDDLNVKRTISVSPYPKAPLSSSPEGVVVSPDMQNLYVINSGSNEVMMFALNGSKGPETRQGRLPMAWYPSSAVVSLDSKTLFVTNAKGFGAGPNPPVDITSTPTDANNGNHPYVGTMIQGTLSTVSIPSKGQLQLYTAQVERNNREQSVSEIDQRNPGNPIPLPGGKSPIKHVIYIIKENRTYDQVFGDMPKGDGSKDLALYGRSVTPNLHALAQRFGLLDNFYADAEVSADGHNWSTSAFASDYNEKMWPQNYSQPVSRNRGYDFEGGSNIELSGGGYLWDSAMQAKISYRDYGEFAQNANQYQLIPESQASSCPGPIAHSSTAVTIPAGQVICYQPTTVNAQTTPNLVNHLDPNFRSFDLDYRETDRVAEWQREFQNFESHNNLPQLELLRLPNDHTYGTTSGKLTPQAMVAENDYGVGSVIQTLSHSKDWKDTAVFIVEDDAQNGPDHVDAHRTTALVVSPYTSHVQLQVDHTIYDTSAMVRTMELILGLRPLSQYDENALPMWRTFQGKADLRPYSVLPESVPSTQLNTAQSYGAQQSAKMDFSQEDRIPMDQLNEILWHQSKGANVPYPGSANNHSSSNQPDNDN